MRAAKALNEAVPQTKASIPWIPISVGLLGGLAILSYTVKGESNTEGGESSGNNKPVVEDKDAVFSDWGPWGNCHWVGKKGWLSPGRPKRNRYRTVLEEPTGRGTYDGRQTPKLKETKNCYNTLSAEHNQTIYQTNQSFMPF
ncbi:MAG: hypothetical protein ACW972_02110 [Promethearchaeota archaeon]|jgi:hypothetical protein